MRSTTTTRAFPESAAGRVISRGDSNSGLSRGGSTARRPRRETSERLTKEAVSLVVKVLARRAAKQRLKDQEDAFSLAEAEIAGTQLGCESANCLTCGCGVEVAQAAPATAKGGVRFA